MSVVFNIAYTSAQPKKNATEFQTVEWKNERAFYDLTAGYNYVTYSLNGAKTAKHKDILDYMQKDTGAFNLERPLTAQDVKDIKERLAKSKSIIWHGFISFDKETSTAFTTPEQARKYLKQTMGALFERQFLIHLYSESDDNLYMEYKFGIDTVIAVVNVVDSNNVAVEKGGYTNQSFSLNWTEANVRVKYTIGSNAISATYARGDVLSGNGMYTFTVTDRVGNTETFTIYLDNVVDYTLDGGKIVNVGGRYLTNSPVALTINEMISEWNVADGKQVVNGVPITEEGIYSIMVSDRYGNTITIVIELDLTPPELEIKGAEDGGATKEDVTVTFEDGAKGYLMKGNTVIREIKSGEIFTEHGYYAVRVEDLAGNIVNIKFTIDRNIDFESNIINRQITTEIVAFSLSEEGVIEIMKDGQAIDVAKNYSESGKYVLTATDAVGNALVFTFTILPKNAQSLNIELDGKQIVSSSKFNGEDIKLDYSDDTKKNIVLDKTGRYTLTISDIEQNQSYTVYLNIDNVTPDLELIWSKNTVSFSKLNKDGVTAKFTKDGVEMKWSQSLVIKEPGHYVLELVDEFGNSNMIEWDIKYKLNGLSIALIVGAVVVVVGVVVLILVKRLKVQVS